MFGVSYNSGAGRLLGIDMFVFFLPGSLLGYRWCPMLDLSEKIVPTSGNAMDIFSICGQVGRIWVYIYLFQSFVLLFVDLSSICLGKGFAPLRCTCNAEAP